MVSTFKLLVVLHIFVTQYILYDFGQDESGGYKNIPVYGTITNIISYVLIMSSLFLFYRTWTIWNVIFAIFILIFVVITNLAIHKLTDKLELIDDFDRKPVLGCLRAERIKMGEKHFNQEKYVKNVKKFIFLIEKVLMLTFLLWAALYLNAYFNIRNSFMVDLLLQDNVLNWLLAILILTRVFNTIFKTLFSDLKPLVNTDFCNDCQKKISSSLCADCSDKVLRDSNNNAGALIGSLERLILLILLVSGNYTSVGFVIAGKSVARFKELENKEFSEYFLAGTFISFLGTFLLYYILF